MAPLRQSFQESGEVGGEQVFSPLARSHLPGLSPCLRAAQTDFARPGTRLGSIPQKNSYTDIWTVIPLQLF